MKHSIIADILHGRRGTQEDVKPTEDAQKLYFRLEEISKQLTGLLTPQQQKLFHEFCETSDSALCQDVDSFYLTGFKVGLLIGIECMEELTTS